MISPDVLMVSPRYTEGIVIFYLPRGGGGKWEQIEIVPSKGGIILKFF